MSIRPSGEGVKARTIRAELRRRMRVRLLSGLLLWGAAGCSSAGSSDSRQIPAASGNAGASGSVPEAGDAGATGNSASAGNAGATGDAASSGNAIGESGASSSGSAPGSSGWGAGSGSGASGSTAGANGSGGSAGIDASSMVDGAAPGYGVDASQSGDGDATAPLPPPVPDATSKVPISKPGAGYTVVGNLAYGPLTAQRLDVMYPVGAGPQGNQLLPVVLMFHGGAWIHSYTNNYPSGKDHMSTFFDRFLAHGFMVCNAEYRVNDGTPDGAVAPAAVEDALLAAKWCWDYASYFHGDRSHYVVTGASAGGHLALMVGMATPAAALGPTSPADYRIAAIVDGYGPADIEAEINGVAKAWIPPTLPNRAAIAKEVNPMTYVRKDIPPLIVVQGANDSTAPIGDSVHLVALLSAAGADVTMHEVPGAGHGFDTPATAWPDAEKAMFGWLVGKGFGK